MTSLHGATVAVTGGTGFIGRLLVNRLVAGGCSVRVLTRDPDGAQELWGIGGAEGWYGDLADPSVDLDQFLTGASALFHCAGELHDTSRMEAVHVGGTQRLVSAAEGRVRRWVQLSSVGAYGRRSRGVVTEETPLNPVGPYEESKAQSDRIVEESAILGAFSCVVLRPSIVFGASMNGASLFQWISMIDRGVFFHIGPCGSVASYIPVENVVDALWLSAEAGIEGHRTYIVSDNLDLEAFVSRIAVRLGRPAPRLRLPEHWARAVAGTLGHMPGFPLTQSRVDALTRLAVYSSNRIRLELGYRHRVSMEEGLDAIVDEWMRRRRRPRERFLRQGFRSARQVGSQESRSPICRIATVPITFSTLLFEQVRYLKENGLSPFIVSNPEPLLFQVAGELGVPCRSVPLTRKIDPVRDLAAVIRLARVFRQEGFKIVHSSTPKAGLVTALAGKLAGVPVRIHTYTGQVWVERKGLSRWILKGSDRLIGILDTHCYADSPSQAAYLVENRVVPASKLTVLGDGSVSGVNLERFDPASSLRDDAVQIRSDLGIPAEGCVILFVGRMTRDKGVCELIDAFGALARSFHHVHLLMVGPTEPERDPLPETTLQKIRDHPRIHATGFCQDVERYMALGDIFCLPSYREGFGSVAIEAGAMQLPSVVTRIYGLIDAVVENQTGLFVPAKNAEALSESLGRLIDDEQLRIRMGTAARRRVVAVFSAERVNDLVWQEYRRLLATVTPVLPRSCA